MLHVAARLSRAVNPREPGLRLIMIPRTGVQRARQPSGEGLGRGAPASPATDASEKVQFSTTVHGRRSLSNLRRPPQEVAASCP